MGLLHCPYCNALIEPEDLIVYRRCSYCTQDLVNVLQMYHRYIYKPPSGNVGEFLTNASRFLREERWDRALYFAESAIDLDPTNALCHLYLLMAQVHASYLVNLEDCEESFASYNSYRMFRVYASPYLRLEVDLCLETVIQRQTSLLPDHDDMEEDDDDILDDFSCYQIYHKACKLSASGATSADYSEAAELFAQIPCYEDASERRKACLNMASSLRTEAHMRSFFGATAAVLAFFFAFALLSGGLF